MDFGCFSAAAFAECQSRLARNEITKNIKNVQITAEICRHKAQEKTNHLNFHREFAGCRMQTAAPSADLQIRGRRCSRRMAHSDPPPPSRRAGFQGVSNLHSDFCRLLTSDGPRPIRRPHPQIPLGAPVADPRTPNVGFLADFLPIENSSKIRLLKNAPKTSKVGPLIAQTSILGSRLGQFLHAWIFNGILEIFIIC